MAEHSIVWNAKSRNWQASLPLNRTYLRCQQNYANDILRINGRLTLNALYTLLGVPHCDDGDDIGWVISSEDPNYVDFGLITLGACAESSDGSSIVLTFNATKLPEEQ